MNDIEWQAIDEPYLRGFGATVGNRSAECIRSGESSWLVFRALDGHPVRGEAKPMTRTEAEAHARSFLLAADQPEVWSKSTSAVGTRFAR